MKPAKPADRANSQTRRPPAHTNRSCSASATIAPSSGRPRIEIWFSPTEFVSWNRHFTLDTHSPAEIGHKALARSLSDLAAMGAEPLFCLVSLAIPASNIRFNFVPRFYKGLLALAASNIITLAGGDLARFRQCHCRRDVLRTVPCGKACCVAARNLAIASTLPATGGSSAGFCRASGQAWKRHLRLTPASRQASPLQLHRLGIQLRHGYQRWLVCSILPAFAQNRKSAPNSSHPLPLRAVARSRRFAWRRRLRTVISRADPPQLLESSLAHEIGRDDKAASAVIILLDGTPYYRRKVSIISHE